MKCETSEILSTLVDLLIVPYSSNGRVIQASRQAEVCQLDLMVVKAVEKITEKNVDNIHRMKKIRIERMATSSQDFASLGFGDIMIIC